jgi:hypothetical protein
MLKLTPWLDGFAAHDAQGRFRGFAPTQEAARECLARRPPVHVGWANADGEYRNVPGLGRVWHAWWEAKGRRLPRTRHPGGTRVEDGLLLDMETGELFAHGAPEEVVVVEAGLGAS